MLHADPAMTDIDIDHWRNLQQLVLDSFRAKRRLVVIHDGGTVRKLAHSEGAPITGSFDRVDDPHAVAQQLYEANVEHVDVVLVVERRALDEHTAAVANSWDAEEDVDSYVHRMYARLDDFADGIVTHPGPARHVLGLQWRLGAPYEQVVAALRVRVEPGSTAVFGVFDGDALWTSLVLGFDADHEITLVTTADPTELHGHGRDRAAGELVDWVNVRHPRCSYSLFTDLDGARELLGSPKGPVLHRLAAAGRLFDPTHD